MITRFFTPIILTAAFMFATAPLLISQAPYESTMGMIQKIFYYHVPPAILMLVSGIVCGVASARYLMTRQKRHDYTAVAAAELALIFGVIVLVTGPLWARKAWGVYWDWDVRLTSSLLSWMVGIAYLLVRKYGGPGSDKLAAGLALFGMANVPFIYISVNYWRTIHPQTTVVPTLPASMGVPLWFCLASFVLAFVLLLKMRVRLEEQRARLDALYLSLDD